MYCHIKYFLYIRSTKNTLNTVTMNASFRTEVFLRAYRLTLTGKTFSESLKQSWAIYRLQKQMRTSIVEFRFRKISGEIRLAYGTLIDTVINPLIKGTKKHTDNTLITYFDYEKQAFRCFKEANYLT